MKTGLIVSLLLALANDGLCYRQGTSYYGNYEFAYFDEGEDTVEFSAAQNTCPVWRTGAYLARPTDSAINDAMTESTNPDYYKTWLGGNDIGGEGYYKWTNGNPIIWTNWNNGQPDDKNNEDCIGFNFNAIGQWNDFSCSEDLGYVCQVARNRALPFDHSELVFSDLFYDGMEVPVTFWQAKARCLELGSRLVQVKDDTALNILRKKLENKDMEYWVDLNTGDDRCMIFDEEGSKTRDCTEAGRGFICEFELPNDMAVSDHQPVITESGNLRVECTASGFPMPDVAWYRDDKLVPGQSIGTGRSTLAINNASTENGGKYFCHATNTVNGVEQFARSFTDVTVTA